jgi:hypothetical protein
LLKYKFAREKSHYLVPRVVAVGCPGGACLDPYTQEARASRESEENSEDKHL